MVPWSHPSPDPKWHLDRSSLQAPLTLWATDTDRSTHKDHATCVVIGRIFASHMRHSLYKPYNNLRRHLTTYARKHVSKSKKMTRNTFVLGHICSIKIQLKWSIIYHKEVCMWFGIVSLRRARLVLRSMAVCRIAIFIFNQPLRPTQPTILSGMEMSTGQGTVPVICCWEGNLRSGITLATRHRH